MFQRKFHVCVLCFKKRRVQYCEVTGSIQYSADLAQGGLENTMQINIYGGMLRSTKSTTLDTSSINKNVVLEIPLKFSSHPELLSQ